MNIYRLLMGIVKRNGPRVSVLVFLSLVSGLFISDTCRAHKQYDFEQSKSSIFGIGYATRDARIPPLYARTGIHWMKIAGLKWKFIEPNPPTGSRHEYHWNELDQVVQNYQRQGFHLQIILKTDSNWGTRSKTREAIPGSYAESIASAPPKEACWDDYTDFVAAVVERYDHDGVNDMPGLLTSIGYYEFESEAQFPDLWQGTVEEYLRLLKLAGHAARKAYPNVKIILSGLNLSDMFDDLPDADLVQRRINSMMHKPVHSHAIRFIQQTLQATDLYDIIEFHYNRDYLSIYGIVNWIRQYSDKPIWAGDAASAPWLFGQFNRQYKNAHALFASIASEEPEASAWYRKEQAVLTVKKLVVSAETGLERVFMETTVPWHKANTSPVAVDYMWDLQSMIDDNYRPYPVFFAIKQLIDNIGDYSAVKRLDIDDKAIFAYRFTTPRGYVFIAWYEPGLDDQKNNSSRNMPDLKKYISNNKATAVLTITSNDTTEVLPIKNASDISITPVPVFIRYQQDFRGPE